MTPKEALLLPMRHNDAGAKNILGYFQCLLSTLFEEGEGFSGKRPFGNSGWEYDVALPLIHAGVVPGELDGEGYVSDYNESAFNSFVQEMIEALSETARAQA